MCKTRTNWPDKPFLPKNGEVDNKKGIHNKGLLIWGSCRNKG